MAMASGIRGSIGPQTQFSLFSPATQLLGECVRSSAWTTWGVSHLENAGEVLSSGLENCLSSLETVFRLFGMFGLQLESLHNMFTSMSFAL